MINGKFSCTTELTKKLAELLGKIGIKLNVKAEPYLHIRFAERGAGPYGSSLWIFIYVWDTGEMVTDPILLQSWNAPGAGHGEAIPLSSIEDLLKGVKRVRDSIKRPHRGVAKQVVEAKMGRNNEHKPTGKVEVEYLDINKFKF